MDRKSAVLVATIALGVLGPTPGRAQAAAPGPSSAAEGPSFDSYREDFLARARAAYLDKSGLTPMPMPDFPEDAARAAELAQLKSLAGQAAYVQAGRGDESLGDYAAMVVDVAARLGVKPPEVALAVYRDRVRSPAALLTPELIQSSAELAADVHRWSLKSRYLFLDDVVGIPVPGVKPAPVAKRGKGRRRKAPVTAPPEPQGPVESVLDSVDWDRAEELASAADRGALGWYTASRKRARREQRKRRGRCYEWVRMALQKTGLWTNEYRDEVTQRGDWRRPHRAFSFAWAMNLLEEREQRDPADARKAPLRRLDLRVDPLVIGSIIVFDRNVCGYNTRSGHIEVVSSIEPLQASSYKFHEVKLPCLVGAANAGRVHVYVPRRMDAPST